METSLPAPVWRIVATAVAAVVMAATTLTRISETTRVDPTEQYLVVMSLVGFVPLFFIGNEYAFRVACLVVAVSPGLTVPILFMGPGLLLLGVALSGRSWLARVPFIVLGAAGGYQIIALIIYRFHGLS
ncbi:MULTISPECIES: hypothetical protein [unclassified Crossiella]|uniref:hypothetical protein n=1 Tax=unclassified Crossiella TaxID=2620835 RepID=UPI001FFE8999|nr:MULTISPECIES: hypothetical protein [unclassified Crossiella]MCK2238609.1 hypothetical protein [Crossiella sp. S99.2]MCK2251821.1 hypothetical protein [Crossiella sp. S99.1]